MSKEIFPDWKLHKKANLKTKELLTTRAELHRAIQLVGAVGRSYSPESTEDEYGSLSWDSNAGMLVSPIVGEKQGIYAGLNLSKFILGVYHQDGIQIDSLNLHEYKLAEIVDWLRKILNHAGLDERMLSLELPYEIPEYQTVLDEKFRFERKKVFEEFSRLYENAALVLGHYQSINRKHATELKCWPHHFDIATQLIFEDDGEPGRKDFIGLGFSPGDENYKRPYYYINLWPVPEIAIQDLPSIQEASWNVKGWFGATLDIKNIKKLKEAGQQAQLVKGFYDIALREIIEIINLKA